MQPLPEAEFQGIRATAARLLRIDMRGGPPSLYWTMMMPKRDLEVKRCWLVFERCVREWFYIGARMQKEL